MNSNTLKIFISLFMFVFVVVPVSLHAGNLIENRTDCLHAEFPYLSIQGRFSLYVSDHPKRLKEESEDYILHCRDKEKDSAVAAKLAVARFYSGAPGALEELKKMSEASPLALRHANDFILIARGTPKRIKEQAISKLKDAAKKGDLLADLMVTAELWNKSLPPKSTEQETRLGELIELLEGGVNEACFFLPQFINNSSREAVAKSNISSALEQAILDGAEACYLTKYSSCLRMNGNSCGKFLDKARSSQNGYVEVIASSISTPDFMD